MIVNRKTDLDEAIESFRQSIAASSDIHDPTSLYGYFELWTNKESPEKAAQECIELLWELDVVSYATYEFVFRIIHMYGTSIQKSEFLHKIPLCRQDAEMFQKIWKQLNQSNTDSLDSREFDYYVEAEKVKIYFMKNISDYKYIDINQLSIDEDLLFLQHNKLSLDYLQLNQYKCSTGDPHEFQKELIGQSKISCVCPFTGKELCSEACIPSLFTTIHHCIYFFRFESQEIFYLITGYVEGIKVAFYFPSSETIICLRNFCPNEVFLLKLSINSWKSYMVSNSKKIVNFLKKKDIKRKAIILTEMHLAHHLWNKLSGIHRIHEWNKLENIDNFFVAAQPLGKLEDIFPEIPQDKIQPISLSMSNEDYIDIIIENNYLPITYGANFVKQDLADRVYKASLKNCSSKIVQEIENAKKKHFPLLWINVRVNSRSWISQIEGTANIINKLIENFPNLGIIFDGISRLEGESENHFSPTLELERKVVCEIESLICKPVQSYNLIGCAIYENLAWVNNIDLYLSHWGNGLTKPVLIANKPGVTHCNKYALEVPIIERWISWHRERCVLPTYISSDDIQDISNTIYSNKLHVDNNYEINWQVIYQKLLELIPQCKRYSSRMLECSQFRLEVIKANLTVSRLRLAEIRRLLQKPEK